MEVRSQAGILLQPVFVVGLDPVDFSILVGQEGHGAEHLVVVLQTADAVVLREGGPEFLRQRLIRGVSDAQDIDSIGLGSRYEVPVAFREMGRNKD